MMGITTAQLREIEIRKEMNSHAKKHGVEKGIIKPTWGNPLAGKGTIVFALKKIESSISVIGSKSSSDHLFTDGVCYTEYNNLKKETLIDFKPIPIGILESTKKTNIPGTNYSWNLVRLKNFRSFFLNLTSDVIEPGDVLTIASPRIESLGLLDMVVPLVVRTIHPSRLWERLLNQMNTAQIHQDIFDVSQKFQQSSGTNHFSNLERKTNFSSRNQREPYTIKEVERMVKIYEDISSSLKEEKLGVCLTRTEPQTRGTYKKSNQ